MRYCCLIAACDPKFKPGQRCAHCGPRVRKRKPYVRPPWEKVEVFGVTENGDLIMQRPDRLPTTNHVGGKNAMPDDELAAAYPTITEYLVTSQWDDGSPRKPSTISMFVEQGLIKLCLNDRATERCLFCGGESYVSAMKTLEALLMTTNAPWVMSRKPKK